MDGKVVLVAGGTRGIGWAVACGVVQAGGKVLAVGLDPPTQPAPEGLCHQQADLRDSKVVEGLVDATIKQWGRLDGLVHVAGGSGRRWGDGPLHELSDEGWAETMRLNAETVARTNRAALSYWMTHQLPGSIVNVSSVLARHPAPRHFTTHAYAASKAAIEGLTIAAAAHYAPHHIRLNAVAPGLVDTEMAQRATESPEIVQYLERRQPLTSPALGRADDVAAAIVFLVSDQARWITGQIVSVDGGWSVCDGVPTP